MGLVQFVLGDFEFVQYFGLFLVSLSVVFGVGEYFGYRGDDVCLVFVV